MSKTIKIMGLGILLLLLSGFMCSDNYTEQVYQVKLRAGDTVYGVADDYYDLNQNGECFDAFRYRVAERNKSLFANGRKPQIGDTVFVPVMIKR